VPLPRFDKGGVATKAEWQEKAKRRAENDVFFSERDPRDAMGKREIEAN
jgi:hypothetical protein